MVKRSICGRIKPYPPSSSNKKISPHPRTFDTQELRFSFKLIDLCGNPKFSINTCGANYLDAMLQRFCAVSSMTVQEFRACRSSALRSHPIRWQNTSEPNGFAHLNDQLQDEDAYQFELSANAHGRVHGLLLDNTFYVVWLDPNHNLYPRK